MYMQILSELQQNEQMNRLKCIFHILEEATVLMSHFYLDLLHNFSIRSANALPLSFSCGACSDFKLPRNLLTRILPAASWEHETAAEAEPASPSGAGLFLSSRFINRFTKSNTLLLLFITSHTAMLAHTLSPIQLVHIWPEGIFGDIDLSHYSTIFYMNNMS